MCTGMSSTTGPLFMPLYLFLFAVFAALVESMSFNLNETQVMYSRFCKGQKLICLQGDATSSNGILQLTANQVDISLNYSVGRAYYSEPLHLWDSSSGELTNFTTNFSIAISHVRQSSELMADGMAFFLSNSSELPAESKGGYLGLMSERQNGTTSGLVAVEFDSYANADYWDGWDPAYRHIGIDVNAVKSVRIVEQSPRYDTSDISGLATVSYDAITHNLSVQFHNHRRLLSMWYIVDLREILSEWVFVGFSGSTGQNFELNTVNSWEFESTLDVIFEERNKSLNGSRPPAPSTGPIESAVVKNGNEIDHVQEVEKKSRVRLVVGLIVAVGLILVVVTLVLLGIWQRKNKQMRASGPEPEVGLGAIYLDVDDTIIEDIGSISGPRRFPYRQLAAATDNFSSDKRLGIGGFGTVHKGFLENSNNPVAIKRLSRDSKQGTKEYVSEIKTISRLRHKNLVPLVGWCHELSELLLVYEFMANGSLDDHLFNRDRLLSWTTRYNIVLGLASALLYLHTEWVQCVVHRDIKSSNVMLDDDFNAKLGDFGLARLIDHGSGMNTTNVAGTLGYMAPECYMTSKSSKESDVYSFGIVLLEIACGRRSIEPREERDRVQLLDWVWMMYGSGRVIQAADQRLEGAFDKEQMERSLVVGLCCANPDQSSRPSIRQVIAALNFEAAALPYPSKKMPMPIYISSTTTTMVGELSPQPQVSTTSASYAAVPSNSVSGTVYSSTASSKSASSSTSLLASAELM